MFHRVIELYLWNRFPIYPHNNHQLIAYKEITVVVEVYQQILMKDSQEILVLISFLFKIIIWIEWDKVTHQLIHPRPQGRIWSQLNKIYSRSSNIVNGKIKALMPPILLNSLKP